MQYLAHLAGEGRRILVTFPDAPGCQTFGNNRRAALTRAEGALAGWLEANLVAGSAPPRPVASRHRGPKSEWVSVNPLLAVRLELRWARQDLGLSQGELAQRIGVTRQQIALLESPDSNLTLRTLERVARAMDLHLDIQLTRQPNAAA